MPPTEVQDEELRQNLGTRKLCQSHLGELLALYKAHQTSPDTLSGMELTALLTPLLSSHACYPQSSSLHHLNSLQLQFMPLLSYSGLIRARTAGHHPPYNHTGDNGGGY